MKILFLTKYDRLAANTRYRCLQYVPYFESAGIQCDISPLLDDNYLRFKFLTGKFKLLTVLKAYLGRLKKIIKIHDYDAVVLHYELFPYFPPFFEWLLDILGVNYIYDIDDAIFHQYDKSKNPFLRFLLKKKIHRVIKHSKAVLAGNQYLARYASKTSEHISIIPTVVDPERYLSACNQDRNQVRNEVFTIGWIGSPSTVAYVKEKATALRHFCEKYPARLILVGSGKVDVPGVSLEIREWSEETELAELKKFDVGIMPLTDDPWSRGKCGFKLIQYMACGLPVVASPVGVNSELVDEGKSGYLATTDDEWFRALEKLYLQKKMRLEMGRFGIAKVNSAYSIKVFAPIVVQILQEVVARLQLPVHFGNIDLKVTENFGEEWAAFPQSQLNRLELEKIFAEYFSVFPWNKLPIEGGIGADIGCGSGRWATFVSPRVKSLVCVDASARALSVAKENLKQFPNISFQHASIAELPFEKESLDFAYSIGVLHHVPDTEAGMRAIAEKLKPGAPFLVYIYYALDNRGNLYKFIWRMSDLARRVISRMPFQLKYAVSQIVALFLYWPLARIANMLHFLRVLPDSWTLSYYRDKAFYVMRTDALDRFGTRLEKRYTKVEIQEMLERTGFKNIRFSDRPPFWVAVGEKI